MSHERAPSRKVAGVDFSPSGLAARALQTRALVRAPITLYRHGLGWVLGRRVLMLEHTGRRSGQARFVCLEVVDRPAPERAVIVSGFGDRADWYQNLLADHACFVSVGRLRRIPGQARFMTSAEASATLDRYQHAHPGAWDRLRQAIEKAVGHPVGQLPMVELLLDFTLGSTHPPSD
jgi:deazaflavin-dependent oxidoreductase (nitroreductase family)